MCGRYYVDDETAKEIARLLAGLEEEAAAGLFHQGDIYPSGQAPVLMKADNRLLLEQQNWGFPGIASDGGKKMTSPQKRVIFNARSETVREKRMFADSVRHRRCIIPAAGFYEWSPGKEKASFCHKDSPVLYMAGFCHCIGAEKRFVILTTQANASVSPVHSRMPVVLEEEEIAEWLAEEVFPEQILTRVPPLLERKLPSRPDGGKAAGQSVIYEQQSLQFPDQV